MQRSNYGGIFVLLLVYTHITSQFILLIALWWGLGIWSGFCLFRLFISSMESPGFCSVLLSLSMEKQGLLTSSVSVTETADEQIYQETNLEPVHENGKMKPKL